MRLNSCYQSPDGTRVEVRHIKPSEAGELLGVERRASLEAFSKVPGSEVASVDPQELELQAEVLADDIQRYYAQAEVGGFLGAYVQPEATDDQAQTGSLVGFVEWRRRTAREAWNPTERASAMRRIGFVGDPSRLGYVGVGCIDRLFVDPSQYRDSRLGIMRNIGSILLHAALREIDAAGLGIVSLYTVLGNDRATEFYKKVGFKALNVQLRAASVVVNHRFLYAEGMVAPTATVLTCAEERIKHRIPHEIFASNP